VSQILFAFKKRFAFVCLLLALVPFATAQESGDYLQATGFPAFGVTVPVELGYIDLANGNLHLEIPIAAPPQRGLLKYNARFVYDSRIWQPVVSNGNTVWAAPTAGSMQSPGAYSSLSLFTDTDQLSASGTSGRLGWTDWSSVQTCNGTNYYTASQFSATYGPTTRYFDVPISSVANSCENWPTTNSGYATDGSGYQMYVTMTSSTTWDATLYAPDGTDVWNSRDTNGNHFAINSPSGPLIDTLGRTPVTISTNGSAE
jgi:hypothetical protein